MSDSGKRDEWERHNRDEATARAAQQAAAGPTHRPVPPEPYVSSSVQPAPRDAELDLAVLIDEYDRAMEAERQAWLAIRDGFVDGGHSEAWNAWRDAVERTQRAARSLVNCSTARST